MDWEQPRIQPPPPVLSKYSCNSQLWFRAQTQFRITPINLSWSLLIGPAVTQGELNFFPSLCTCQPETTSSVWFGVAQGTHCVLMSAGQVWCLSSSITARMLGQSAQRAVLIYRRAGSQGPFNNPVGCQMLQRTFLVWIFIFITACHLVFSIACTNACLAWQLSAGSRERQRGGGFSAEVGWCCVFWAGSARTHPLRGLCVPRGCRAWRWSLQSVPLTQAASEHRAECNNTSSVAALKLQSCYWCHKLKYALMWKKKRGAGNVIVSVQKPSPMLLVLVSDEEWQSWFCRSSCCWELKVVQHLSGGARHFGEPACLSLCPPSLKPVLKRAVGPTPSAELSQLTEHSAWVL